MTHVLFMTGIGAIILAFITGIAATVVAKFGEKLADGMLFIEDKLAIRTRKVVTFILGAIIYITVSFALGGILDMIWYF